MNNSSIPKKVYKRDQDYTVELNSIQSENKVEGVAHSLGMDDSKKLDQVFLNL